MASNTFADPVIIKDFKEKLPELSKRMGLIIDLRTNGGGCAMITTTIQMVPDGRKYRDGIKPDIEVYPTVQDIIENKDPVLKKGIEILNDKIK